MTTVLTTYARASVVEAEVIAAVSRTKARVAAQSTAFCGDQSTNVWFPVAPGITQPAAPAPTTNASPAPPNSVALPPGFDPTDTCYIFQDLLPLSTAPVYAEELEPTIILEPYTEIVPLLGITVASLSIREYPYELTLPTETVALVTYQKADFVIFDITFYTVTITSGIYTLTGNAIDTAESLGELIATGTYTLTGNDIQTVPVFADYTVDIALGTYALTGNAIAVSGSSTIIDVSAITYTQSSVYVDNTAATNATMTNGVTAEATSTGTDLDSPSFVTMDLGAILPVATIYVGSDFANTLAGFWGPSYTENADLEYSTDGSSWTIITSPIGSFTSGLKGFSVDFFARYIRIVANDYIALTEFYATSTEDSAVGSSDIINSGTYALTGNDIGAAQNFTVTITNGTYTMTGNNIGVTGSNIDSNFSSVSLLLHMDGSNGSTTITDSSNNGLFGTAWGSAQISTAQSMFGGASCTFDGSGDYIDIPGANTLFDFTSGSFSVEIWTYQTASKLVHVVSYNVADWRIDILADGSVAWVTPNSNKITSSANAAPLNQWNFLAAISDGTTTTLYVNGSSVGTTTSKPTAAGGGNVGIWIGKNADDTTRDFNGYLDDLRITKGVARSNTVPTAAFPDS